MDMYVYFCHFPPQWPLSQVYGAHYSLIALIWIPLVKSNPL